MCNCGCNRGNNCGRTGCNNSGWNNSCGFYGCNNSCSNNCGFGYNGGYGCGNNCWILIWLLFLCGGFWC